MTIIRIINQQLRGNNTIIRVWYCVTICPQPAALGLIDCVDRCSISVLFLSLSLSLSLSLFLPGMLLFSLRFYRTSERTEPSEEAVSVPTL